MKKIIALLTTLFILGCAAGSVMAGSGPFGPTLKSGDGICDGSGSLDTPNGPQNDNETSPGPAPNSGDGIPDGSGF